MTVAMVFPGQGSQSVGMLKDMAAASPLVETTFGEASDILGYDLWQRVCEGPAELLSQTRCTQPLMLTAGVAMWRVWRKHDGPLPSITAGHSLGEYSALVAAGSLEFANAMSLVAERARLMQEAVPEGHGGIAAVLGLDDDAIVALCAQISERLAPQQVSAVNFNAPGQVVVAGHREAVDVALTEAKAAGARRAIALPMSVPVHCELMRPAASALAPALDAAQFEAPQFPVLQNADLSTHSSAQAIREALTAQLYTPVRWSATVQSMAAQGVTTLVECGPGRVLSGLARRIDRNLACAQLEDPKSLDEALTRVGAMT